MLPVAVYIIILIILATAVIWVPALAIVAAFLMFPLDQWVQMTSRHYISDQSFTNYAVAAILLLALLLDLKKRLTENYGKAHVGIDPPPRLVPLASLDW